MLWGLVSSEEVELSGQHQKLNGHWSGLHEGLLVGLKLLQGACAAGQAYPWAGGGWLALLPLVMRCSMMSFVHITVFAKME